MVKSKSIWSDQNCFGHIEGQGINVVQYSIISDEHISLYDIYVVYLLKQCKSWMSIQKRTCEILQFDKGRCQ